MILRGYVTCRPGPHLYDCHPVDPKLHHYRHTAARGSRKQNKIWRMRYKTTCQQLLVASRLIGGGGAPTNETQRRRENIFSTHDTALSAMIQSIFCSLFDKILSDTVTYGMWCDIWLTHRLLYCLRLLISMGDRPKKRSVHFTCELHGLLFYHEYRNDWCSGKCDTWTATSNVYSVVLGIRCKLPQI